MISEFSVKQVRNKTVLIVGVVTEKNGFASFHDERHEITDEQSQRLADLVTEILNENNVLNRERTEGNT